jgi:TFIIF-interacting CTD phosphatase-like protein
MLHLGMEHIRKIMEIMDDDEMFPTRNEWAYVKISNELKKLHFKIKELSHSQATIDPSARVERRSSATIDPSAPPRIIRDAWRDLHTLRVRPRR